MKSNRLVRLGLLAGAAAAMGAITPNASAGLVSYYNFEGNLNDPVSGYNGTAFNGPTFTAGQVGQAIELNGTNQYAALTTGANFGLGGNFTVSAFVFSDVLSVDKTILGNDAASNNNALHLITRGTKAHMGFYGNDTAGNANLSTGTWNHITYRFKNGEQSIYINGVIDNSTPGHAAFAGTASTVNLGRWNSGNYFDGKIDELAIYNHALTASDIGYLATGVSPLTLANAPSRKLVEWDFRLGDFNNWKTINGPAAYRSADGGGIVANATGGGFALDNDHVNMVFRSPQFVFTGETYDGVNVLSVNWAGGQGDQENNGPSFTSPAGVISFNGGNSGATGEKAVAILDLTTNQYVGWLFNTGNGTQGFTHLTLAQFNALNLDLNRYYALDFYENDEGGWGWTQMRQVLVAAAILPEPASMGLLAVAGIALMRRRRTA